MKKSIIGILALTGCFSVLSCQKDKEVEQEDFTRSEQQFMLEQSVIDLTQVIPASEFQELRGFINEVIGIGFSIDPSGIYLMDSLNSASKMVGDTILVDTLTGQSGDSEYACSIQSDYLTMIETSLMLSNFTGHYTATDSSTWAYTKADDLQFIFKDSLKNTCVLKLSRQGDEVELSTPSKYDYVNGKSYKRSVMNDTVRYDRNVLKKSIKLSIPEKVVLSLSRKDKSVVTATIKTELGNLSDGYFNIGTSKMGIEASLKTNNGLVLSLAVDYDANKAVSSSISMEKSDQNVISFNMSATPSGMPAFVVNDSLKETVSFDSLRKSVKDVNVQKAYVTGNVMDQVKIIGSLTDINKFMELSDSLDKAIKSEVKFKAIVEELNEMSDIYLCFDGSDKQQARLEMEAESKSTYDGSVYYERWRLSPVIVLADGTRASIGEYFDREQYVVAYYALRRMVSQYMRLIMTGSPYRQSLNPVSPMPELEFVK